MEPIHISDLFDLPGWLLLSKEVEPLFGPMADNPEFFNALSQAVMNGNAICIRDDDNTENCGLCGGIIISKETNSIAWFAVHSRFRNKGIGKRLIKEAMKYLNHSQPITVCTSDESVQEGLAARKLYHNLGFKDSSPGETNPAGIKTVIMTKPALDCIA